METDTKSPGTSTTTENINISTAETNNSSNTKVNEYVNIAEFEQIQKNYDEYNEKRDTIIKKSRDILRNSKHAIYALHRQDFDKTDELLKKAWSVVEELWPTIEKEPSLRNGR